MAIRSHCVQTSKRLSCLKSILKAWREKHLKYAEELSECGWWYNERASVGFLAAAAWECGGVALEEYSSGKRGRSRTYKGRCDLYFALGRPHSTDFIAEAKKAWVTVKSPTSGRKQISVSLDKAARDAIACSDPVRRRLGIVFAVPRFHPRSIDSDPAVVRLWFEELVHLKKTDALAWVLPSKWRKFKGDDAYIYPGVAILIRVRPTRLLVRRQSGAP